MAIFINSTRVITNVPNVDWTKFSGTPSSLITSLVRTTTGDATNNPPSALTRVNTVTYTLANTTLSVNFDTNCVIDCDCACACACGG